MVLNAFFKRKEQYLFEKNKKRYLGITAEKEGELTQYCSVNLLAKSLTPTTIQST